MSKFIPQPGTLFYATCARTVNIPTGGDVSVYTRVIDRSFQGCIFRCKAIDHHMLVAKIEGQHSYMNDVQTLLLSDFSFSPVGPTIAEALGIEP